MTGVERIFAIPSKEGIDNVAYKIFIIYRITDTNKKAGEEILFGFFP